MSMPFKHGTPAAACLLLGALLLTAGCSKAQHKPLVFASASEQARVLQKFSRDDPVEAFQGWIQAVDESERLLDPNYPGLRIYGMGGAVADVQNKIKEFTGQGVHPVKPEQVINPRVTARGSDKGHKVVIVTSCIDEAVNTFADVKTGTINPPAGSELQKHLAVTDEATIVEMSDGWHVDGNKFRTVASCPASS